jgi:hypothetical protein
MAANPEGRTIMLKALTRAEKRAQQEREVDTKHSSALLSELAERGDSSVYRVRREYFPPDDRL